MTGWRSWMVAALAAAVVSVGCTKSEDDDLAPAILPKQVAFDGKVDEKYVGDWKTSDGVSSLDLAKDGGLKVGGTTNSPQGKKSISLSGKWLVSGDKLRLQYADGTGQPTTLEYAAVLEGDKMTLTQPGGRVKTVYLRK